MPADVQDTRELGDLDARIRTMLPAIYQETYKDLQPVPMRSAALKYSEDGRVAWDEIWGSFCDLAMAGGPPHRGTLLEPGSHAEIAAQPEPYQNVAAELCRGIGLVTGLFARPSSNPGWIRVDCTSAAMAAWLARAITMENVAARFQGLALGLPAGPAYRMEKEIKNVIVAMAKTSHYWLEHMSPEQHDAVGDLLRTMDRESPPLQPAWEDDNIPAEKQRTLASHLADAVHQATGLSTSSQRDGRWLGLECEDVQASVWMMRALVVRNVLARREGTTVLLPINQRLDPSGKRTEDAVVRTRQLI